MSKIGQKLKNAAVKIYSRLGGGSLRQSENVAPEGSASVPPEVSALLRRAAAEGAVLLENDGTLPLKGKVALFGRVQTDTFYTGYGSGGNVLKPYRVSILDGVAQNGKIQPLGWLADIYRKFSKEHPVNHGYWGNWPFCFPEMPLREELAARAAEEAETAVVVIGRAAGEERDNELKAGSYYLTAEEERLLQTVTSRFKKTAVVLNIGSLIDLSWTEKFRGRIGALLIIWQGGMEAGNALADILSGEVSPCGKLTDTVAREYSDYPSARSFGNAGYNEYQEDIYVGYRYFSTFAREKVRYPFGYGLSYTKFRLDFGAPDWSGDIRVRVCVTNAGECAGKEAVQVYVKKPCGGIGNPARELVGFFKTKLLQPREGQETEIVIPVKSLASFDEARACFFLFAGEYTFYAGADSANAQKIGAIVREREEITERCTANIKPKKSFSVLAAREEGEKRVSAERTAAADSRDNKAQMLASLPPALAMTGDKGYTLSDVKSGRASMEQFIAQLSVRELEALSRGADVMDSPLGAKGNAGVYGGVSDALRKKGIPPLTAVDGPSGIRLCRPCALLPVGTLLASTFDEELVGQVYAAVGREMKAAGAHVLLAPGMNIHRNPLCGRNFEYYSEDPLLTGRIAAAAVRGVQSAGVSACPKHFCCNNQEFDRTKNDSRVSERALREIYLRAFEICVKEGAPRNLMTSYNKINGIWAHYHFPLVRGVLRGEWGYKGCVITDWWMRRAKCPEFPKLKYNAYRIRAGINVLMPGGSYLKMAGLGGNDKSVARALGKKGGLTLGELQRNAAEILNFMLLEENNGNG